MSKTERLSDFHTNGHSSASSLSRSGESGIGEADSPGVATSLRAGRQPVAELDGAVCLVTGGGRGLGQAICENLSDAGATVVVADLRGELAQQVSAKLREAGYPTSPTELDVQDAVQVGAAVEQIVRRWGRLDVLVNNAAVDVTLPIDQLSVADWDRVVATNLRGPFLLCKAAFPVMKVQGGGRIVNIASTASKRAWPNAAAYHASKWGLLGLSHALHAEGRPHRIKVTAIVCGGMRTPFLLDRFPDIDEQNLQDPRNVARTVRFALCQPAETVIPEMMVLPMRETSWP